MKTFVQMIVVLLLSSCGFGEIEVGMHSGSDGIWYGPSYGKHMSGTYYAVGLDYPDGYDWRADLDKSAVNCSMIMFADGIPVLRVPVGDRYEVSSETSRHRIRSGNLYTDYTDGNTTVIKRDGTEILRYDGSEDIVSMEIHEGRIHTLGVSGDGGGFVYRVDGDVVLERTSGNILHGLYVYDGRMCFCFSQHFAISSDLRYYLVEDGKVSLIEMEKDVEDVLDVGIYDDGLYVLAKVDGVTAPVLMKDGVRDTIGYHGSSDIVSCSFLETESVCVRVRYSSSGMGHLSDIIWLGGQRWRNLMQGGLITSICCNPDGWHAVVHSSGGNVSVVFSSEKRYALPSGYHAYGTECVTAKDSMVYAALTSVPGKKPVIWMNGSLDTLDINGPLTCLR